MPIYEYECPRGGHRFEALQPMDTPPATCPEHGDVGRKVFSRFSTRVEGSPDELIRKALKNPPTIEEFPSFIDQLDTAESKGES